MSRGRGRTTAPTTTARWTIGSKGLRVFSMDCRTSTAQSWATVRRG